MSVKIGSHIIPLWVLGAIMISFCVGAFAAYTALTLRIPFEVAEPLEVLNSPQAISLYPGENITLTISIQNHASQEYVVFLNFSLETPGLNSYVTFSQKNYAVLPGSQDLTAWVAAAPDAPVTSTTLTAEIIREPGTEQIQITSMTFGTNWIAVVANNTGTVPVTISAVYLNNAATPITTFATGQSPGTITAGHGAVINMTTTVTNGYNYQVKLVSSKGNFFLYSAVAPSS